MGELLHYQPFKGLYLAFFFIILFLLKIPFWFIYYGVKRSNRPRESWTVSRTIMVRIFQELTGLPRKAGVQTKRNLSKEVSHSDLKGLNARFCWIQGLEESELFGEIKELALKSDVKPIRIPGYWLLRDNFEWLPGHERAAQNEKVLLHFHGGAYVVGSAHPSDMTANVTTGLLKHSRTVTRAFAADYRLSSSAPFVAENPFPAALLDALAAYKYLVCTAKFLPKNIIVVGDSAGGNLGLTLTRYLIEYPIPDLPPPGSLVLLSPWADLSSSRATPNSSHMMNLVSDILTIPGGVDLGKFAVTSYLGPLDVGHVETHRYISPGSVQVQKHPEENGIFTNFPRSYVVGGGAEILFDDIVALSTTMKADGVDVQTDFPPDAVHDFTMFRWHEPERTEVLSRVAAWIDQYSDLLPYTDYPVANDTP